MFDNNIMHNYQQTLLDLVLNILTKHWQVKSHFTVASAANDPVLYQTLTIHTGIFWRNAHAARNIGDLAPAKPSQRLNRTP